MFGPFSIARLIVTLAEGRGTLTFGKTVFFFFLFSFLTMNNLLCGWHIACSVFVSIQLLSLLSLLKLLNPLTVESIVAEKATTNCLNFYLCFLKCCLFLNEVSILCKYIDTWKANKIVDELIKNIFRKKTSFWKQKIHFLVHKAQSGSYCITKWQRNGHW